MAVANRTGSAPLTSQGKLEAPWHRLNDDVMVLDTIFLDLANCACNEGIYDGFVPPCVHYCNP